MMLNMKLLKVLPQNKVNLLQFFFGCPESPHISFSPLSPMLFPCYICKKCIEDQKITFLKIGITFVEEKPEQEYNSIVVLYSLPTIAHIWWKMIGPKPVMFLGLFSQTNYERNILQYSSYVCRRTILFIFYKIH
jgi:hypothetical protein